MIDQCCEHPERVALPGARMHEAALDLSFTREAHVVAMWNVRNSGNDDRGSFDQRRLIGPQKEHRHGAIDGDRMAG
jgi:hypothetical protein